MSIKRHADNIIQYIGPTKTIDGAVLDNSTDNTPSASTCIARVYDEQKAATIAPATTRVRTALAAAATVVLVPHIEPLWLEAGDGVMLTTDQGQTHRTTLASAVAGADEGTPATNFDTLTLTDAIPGACAAGTVITLTSKDSTATIIPIAFSGREPIAGDSMEVQTNTEGSPSRANAVVTGIQSHATEDGEVAIDQGSVYTLTLTSAIAVDSNVGRIVRTQIGAEITLTEYGTDAQIVSGGDEWGWVGTFADDFAGLNTGSLVRVEIIFNNAVNPGFRDVEYRIEPIVEGSG